MTLESCLGFCAALSWLLESWLLINFSPLGRRRRSISWYEILKIPSWLAASLLIWNRHILLSCPFWPALGRRCFCGRRGSWIWRSLPVGSKRFGSTSSRWRVFARRCWRLGRISPRFGFAAGQWARVLRVDRHPNRHWPAFLVKLASNPLENHS